MVAAQYAVSNGRLERWCARDETTVDLSNISPCAPSLVRSRKPPREDVDPFVDLFERGWARVRADKESTTRLSGSSTVCARESNEARSSTTDHATRAVSRTGAEQPSSNEHTPSPTSHASPRFHTR